MKSSMLAFGLIVLLSCRHGSDARSSNGLRDSIVQAYLLEAESREDLDTSDVNYKILKAYLKNDTAFFGELKEEVEGLHRGREPWAFMDSCVHEPRLIELAVDEAYRFNWIFSFCPNKLDLTISKKDSIVNLHIITYRYAWDTISGKVLSECDKRLTMKEWDDFKDKMDRSDFWDLMRTGGEHGLDGDDIVVSGYIRGNTSFHLPPRIHKVNRWLVHRTPFSEAFDMLVMLSGNQQGCGWIERKAVKRK